MKVALRYCRSPGEGTLQVALRYCRSPDEGTLQVALRYCRSPARRHSVTNAETLVDKLWNCSSVTSPANETFPLAYRGIQCNTCDPV
ncbi:hypothetical protein F7725_014839 [Dissostichus mawsoni]|uniref:Uncharacterized protein n=1 Tax=Dissostichus mawsoni TaxID=36200 RepID=A0A7J5YFV4_DISMA|nr:hypothetical protein F7725_014839 [Dissostichus mawsoni]